MVIPSDQTLQNFKCLETQNVNGRSYTIRDYNKYMLEDDRAKRIISTIQNEFNDKGFPLNDFEQILKQLDTQEVLDMADGFEKDAKTMLLTTAQPDNSGFDICNQS
jgi:DNA-binding transcriptional MerR regulator